MSCFLHGQEEQSISLLWVSKIDGGEYWQENF